MTKALARQPRRRSLARYSPDKGLKSVAVYEAAEKHYARARDIKKLEQAIRAKLEAQAEFVLWWDTKGPGKEGKGNVSDRKHYAGRDGLPDRLTIHRWRRKLDDREDFERTFQQVLEKAQRFCESQKGPHAEGNTGDYEWFTPAEYAEAARSVLGGIDLDPASTTTANTVIKAARIFTVKDDGLAQQWHGRVWMNPPYSQPLISQFCAKLAESVRDGTVSSAIALVNNATETDWFRSLFTVATALCFPDGRIRFWHPNKESATPLQGQAVIYIGGNPGKFCKAFQTFGLVVVPWRK